MERNIFGEEHKLFRDSFRTFVQREIVPNQERWIEQGMVDRDIWRKAGEAGFLCMGLDEEYGGSKADFLYSAIVIEELAFAYESGFAAPLHSDIVIPYIDQFGTKEQKLKYLPLCASGEMISAVAMTEPGTGSDLAGIRTTAVKEGDSWVINGSKTFISNGQLCDLILVAAKTNPDPAQAHHGVSLFLVEATTPGFTRGRKLKKIGLHAQDTSELHFEDCRVPATNLLGDEGAGFGYLMQMLQQERLVVAVACQAAAKQVLDDTIKYTQERKAFGKPISKFQNSQFQLVECATKVEVGQAWLDRVLEEHTKGKYLVKECSMAKYWQSDMLCEVVDVCVQLFGGYGYMMEYPVARAYVDARVNRIYAGTNEIMKIIIARQMGL
jgi:acyl-CoA dehydrogenase